MVSTRKDPPVTYYDVGESTRDAKKFAPILLELTFAATFAGAQLEKFNYLQSLDLAVSKNYYL